MFGPKYRSEYQTETVSLCLTNSNLLLKLHVLSQACTPLCFFKASFSVEYPWLRPPSQWNTPGFNEIYLWFSISDTHKNTV